ncbi:lasso peptide biosynthesis B2 protein [Streptomyces sp. NPDC003006]
MSTSQVVPHDPRSVPIGLRLTTRAALACAHLLATQPPDRIRSVLERMKGSARPATLAEAAEARKTVLAVSLTAGGQRGCLVRSLAAVLLCRTRGQWPAWCVGARTHPPFAVHAWIEAEGILVGEGVPADYFQRFFTVT